jgi:hypothetical protein
LAALTATPRTAWNQEQHCAAVADLLMPAFSTVNYEPAVMLLLGIRSVVRRGVTIC